MFDTTLSKKINYTTCQEVPPSIKYRKKAVLLWEEHCVECAPPFCYNNCENYRMRVDKKCVRLQNGFQITKERMGSLKYGVDCLFRKWAKIETSFYSQSVTNKQEIRIARFYRVLGIMVLFFAKMMRFVWPTLKPYGAYVYFRNSLLPKIGKAEQVAPDLLYICCLLKGGKKSQLLIQIDTPQKILFSKIFHITEGDNEIKIPLKTVLNKVKKARVFLSPLGESDTHIVFSWADILYGVEDINNVTDVQPSDKVKVVAWDLDNTIWDGVLIEDGDVRLRQQVVDVIKEFDRRGILNTIVSKNDHDEAMEKLKAFGINDYFLSPAINWGQKSENIRHIADILNLGLNSFAFIDDNIRERSEVQSALPMIRIYADTDVLKLADLPEFDVPITETSKNRRQSYMQEVDRKKLQETFNDDYDAFLENLFMVLSVEKIDTNNSSRCYELLQRSNQLNLSTHRYSQEEYNSLINDNKMLCRAFRVSDKYGDYGIVSFISFRLNGNNAEIIDFVISCRVAKKKIEQAILLSLKNELTQLGVSSIMAKLIKTKRNGPLASVFEELPFIKEEETLDFIKFKLKDIKEIQDSSVVKIISS